MTRFKKLCMDCYGRGRSLVSAWNAERQQIEEKDLGACPTCHGQGHLGYCEYDVKADSWPPSLETAQETAGR